MSVELKGAQPNHILLVSSTIISQAIHKDLFIAFDIYNSLGVRILQAIPELDPFIRFSKTEQRVKTEIELPSLIPDRYKVSVWIGAHNIETMAWNKEVVEFEITESPTKGRGFIVPQSKLIYG